MPTSDGIPKWTEENLKNAITAKYIVRVYREPDMLHFDSFISAKEPLSAEDKDLIMSVINRDGRFQKYLEYLRYEISYAKIKNHETVDFHVDIGAVIFLEYVIMDVYNEPYTCEHTQFYLLLDPSIDSVKTVTRRGSKTFSDKIVAFRDCVINPGFKIQVTEQSMTTAKLWLDDIYMWWWNSKLIQEWSGGALENDSVHYIQFRNTSSIILHTASSIESLSGIGVHKQIYDEKSLYASDTARARITARGQDKKKGRGRIVFRISGTPYGDGTSFHKDQINLDKWQYFAPLLCPNGYEKPVCYDCDFFTQTKFRTGELPTLESLECTAPLPMKDGNIDINKMYCRIPPNRYPNDEIMVDYRDLIKELWMQEFMCATIEYTGTAISLELIHAIVDDKLEQNFKSNAVCYVGVDFGLSENHRSAIVVVGVNDKTGILETLNVIILPAGTPYRTRDSTTGDHRKGVIETVIDLFHSYPNIYKIVADATGVGKDYVERDMVDLCMKHQGFSNVIPFKITGESKAPLWFGTVKPAMESGRVKTYMDRQLYLQMRAWRCVYDASKHSKPKLIPPSTGAVKSDDALIAWFLALHGALKDDSGRADEDVSIGGILPDNYEGQSAMEKGFYGFGE